MTLRCQRMEDCSDGNRKNRRSLERAIERDSATLGSSNRQRGKAIRGAHIAHQCCRAFSGWPAGSHRQRDMTARCGTPNRQRDPRLTGHSYTVGAVAISPDSRLALTACTEKRPRGCGILRRGELKEFRWTHYPVVSVAFSPDGKMA